MGVTIFSPAKINLYLAVTGRRADGYHNLVSVAAPLDFGDDLEVSWQGDAGSAAAAVTLECDDDSVPTGASNLVVKAAQAFLVATGSRQGVHFKLTKRIPIGAGLGGGSSNAVAALRALNQLTEARLSEVQLEKLAGALGSDCTLFLKAEPVLMRGRGERIESLPPAAGSRLRGRRVLLFKPGFAIGTPWAYGRMAADPGKYYLPEPEAEARLASGLRSEAPAPDLFFNNMEAMAFEKFIALPVLREKLRKEFSILVQMSGSGSACFVWLDGGPHGSVQDVSPAGVGRIKQVIADCWGPRAFVREARLL